MKLRAFALIPLTAALVACGSSEAATPTTTTVTATVTETATVTVTAAAQPTTTAAFPDGAYLIGTEMPAGNYTATDGTGNCVWVIFDSAHNPTNSGFGRVASVPADGYDFESTGCGTWTVAD